MKGSSGSGWVIIGAVQKAVFSWLNAEVASGFQDRDLAPLRSREVSGELMVLKLWMNLL